jgi:hypothetical protein
VQVLSRLGVAALVSVSLTLPQLAFAGMSPVGLSTGAGAGDPLVIQVNKSTGKNWKGKNWAKNKRIYVGPRRVYVRSWRHRPYYCNIIAGAALGVILGVAIAGSPPSRPRPRTSAGTGRIRRETAAIEIIATSPAPEVPNRTKDARLQSEPGVFFA